MYRHRSTVFSSSFVLLCRPSLNKVHQNTDDQPRGWGVVAQKHQPLGLEHTALWKSYQKMSIPEEDNYAANPMFVGMLLLIYLQLSNPVQQQTKKERIKIKNFISRTKSSLFCSLIFPIERAFGIHCLNMANMARHNKTIFLLWANQRCILIKEDQKKKSCNLRTKEIHRAH